MTGVRFFAKSFSRCPQLLGRCCSRISPFMEIRRRPTLADERASPLFNDHPAGDLVWPRLNTDAFRLIVKLIRRPRFVPPQHRSLPAIVKPLSPAAWPMLFPNFAVQGKPQTPYKGWRTVIAHPAGDLVWPRLNTDACRLIVKLIRRPRLALAQHRRLPTNRQTDSVTLSQTNQFTERVLFLPRPACSTPSSIRSTS